MKKKVLVVIPARLKSTRFPEKLLYQFGEKSLIEHVYHNALSSHLTDRVIVATDSHKILNHLSNYKDDVMMTSDSHSNGTERLLEVYRKWGGYDLYINLQGDEPLITGEHLDSYIEQFLENRADIYSLMSPISQAEALNQNNVKVVTDYLGNAMYFSRSVIPFPRNSNDIFYKHIGLYAFTYKALEAIGKMSAVHIEETESLEQLRWLYNGMTIHMTLTKNVYHGVDHPEDVPEIEKLLKSNNL